jgi:hypothetical protein
MKSVAVVLTLEAIVAAFLFLGAAPVEAQDDVVVRGMITPACQDAIDNGLAFLARQQAEDGSFGVGHNRNNIAYTSICGLAFMAGGHQPGRGKYGNVVRKAVEHIVGMESPNVPGYLYNPQGAIHGPMYAHGFAMLFLGEAHGMVSDPALRDKLRGVLGRAVQLTIKAQNRQGGWRYKWDDGDADLSATICQIMALRSARNAGITVPKKVADKCIEYVKSCQDPRSGGFRYQPQGGPVGFARTAAGIDALYSAGLYDSEEVTKALKYLKQFKPGGGGGGNILGNFENQVHYHYGHYYAAQAMWIAGGEYWKEWFPAIRNEMIASQRPDGSWGHTQFSPEYATGMSLIVLQIPNRYLPILQR